MLVLGNGHMGPPMNRQKHTIENIIFLQLRWPAATIQVPNYCNEPVTDPGFPRSGGGQLFRGEPTYDFAKFPQKLNEIERIRTLRGCAPLAPP